MHVTLGEWLQRRSTVCVVSAEYSVSLLTVSYANDKWLRVLVFLPYRGHNTDSAGTSLINFTVRGLFLWNRLRPARKEIYWVASTKYENLFAFIRQYWRISLLPVNEYLRETICICRVTHSYVQHSGVWRALLIFSTSFSEQKMKARSALFSCRRSLGATT